MKKILFLSVLAGGVALNMQAQQLPNGGFDDEQTWGECFPYVAGKFVKKACGTQPKGWTISNVHGMSGTGATQVGFVDNTRNGNAVQLKNTPNPKSPDQIVPAYLTLGTTWSTSRVTMQGLSTVTANNDGGTFGGISFTNKPDAISFDYKTTANQQDKPMILAYLWSGYWEQANVPTEIKLCFTSSMNPATETMKNRDRNILGEQTSQGANPISHNGVRIATIREKIVASTDSWETKIIEFTYDKPNAQPEMINVIFSAGDYFATSANVKNGMTVSIDNVKLLYYHELLSVNYNGTSYNVGANNEVNLTSVAYDATINPTFTVKGVGATTQTTFDEATQTMTVDVLGNDYDAATNPNSKSTYKLKFAKKPAQLTSLKINGQTCPTVLTDGLAYITVRGEYDAAQVETNPSEAVTKSYDAVSRICTITVKGNGVPDGTYFVKYAKPARQIPSQLVIGMGEFLAGPAQNVEVTEVQNGTVDLQLLNFKMEMFGGLLGDIYVTDIPYVEEADGTVKLYKKLSDFKIFGFIGAQISGVGLPLELLGRINKDKTVTATIKITWGNFDITVRTYPIETPFVDATGITCVYIDSIRPNLTNPNAIIYADADAIGAAANDVVGGTCANLTIKEGHDFNAPVAFNATAVNFDRTFNTATNYVSSFVLPFGMNATDVQGKVYKFAGVNGTYVNFTEETGKLTANTPYLIVATAANPFSKAANVQIEATPATMEVTPATAAGYAHVGSYTTKQVTSANGTEYYGYKGGQFVKANSGTLKPFRTMIKATGVASAPAQFSLKLGNEVTGIIGVNSEIGKVNVYNLEGKLVRSQVEAATALQGLEKGVYVINGQKVIK